MELLNKTNKAKQNFFDGHLPNYKGPFLKVTIQRNVTLWLLLNTTVVIFYRTKPNKNSSNADKS